MSRFHEKQQKSGKIEYKTENKINKLNPLDQTGILDKSKEIEFFIPDQTPGETKDGKLLLSLT